MTSEVRWAVIDQTNIRRRAPMILTREWSFQIPFSNQKKTSLRIDINLLESFFCRNMRVSVDENSFFKQSGRFERTFASVGVFRRTLG